MIISGLLFSFMFQVFRNLISFPIGFYTFLSMMPLKADYCDTFYNIFGVLILAHAWSFILVANKQSILRLYLSSL